jgi:hypothetical protein
LTGNTAGVARFLQAACSLSVGLGGIPAEVDAVTVEPGRAMRWEVGALERYLTANAETRTVLLQHVARDLAAKVGRVTAASSKPLDELR